MASALALATEKLPEICALPPRIGSLLDGADSTCPSSTIAKRLPTFCDVTRAKVADPPESKRMATTGRLLCGSKLCCASINRSDEHTSELQSLLRVSYAVFCLKTHNDYTLFSRHPEPLH